MKFEIIFIYKINFTGFFYMMVHSIDHWIAWTTIIMELIDTVIW